MNWLKTPITDRSSDVFLGYSMFLTGSRFRSAGSIFPLSILSPKNCLSSYHIRSTLRGFSYPILTLRGLSACDVSFLVHG